jgi:hypothetical protein
LPASLPLPLNRYFNSFFYFQYIKFRGYWLRRQAERRYNDWQQERLRGFERDQEKIKEWKGENAERPRPNQNSPKPSTSKGQRIRDPLAKARFEWNVALKKEYHEKFQK